jgi:hypothetical protein
MKKIVVLSILLLFAGPTDLPAFQGHRPAVNSVGGVVRATPGLREIRARMKMPIRISMDKRHAGKPVHPIYPGNKPGRPGHGRPEKHPPRYWWPATTTVVREVQPVIIVNNPPPEASATPPPPEKVWVPPVMGTRTKPGYWDHGIKKVWMGDHWRYEQDFEERKWVPETQVTVVEQEGYWKIVE